MSRLLKIISLFRKRALQKRRYSAKESYNLKEPTNRSHPIPLHHSTTDPLYFPTNRARLFNPRRVVLQPVAKTMRLEMESESRMNHCASLFESFICKETLNFVSIPILISIPRNISNLIWDGLYSSPPFGIRLYI